MPTKLPHYSLPVFPALCLLMGASIITMKEIAGFRKTRFFSGLIFALSTAGLLSILVMGQSTYGDAETRSITYFICIIGGSVALVSGVSLMRNKIKFSLGAALLSSFILSIGAYGYTLPHLSSFQTSANLKAELVRFAPKAKSKKIHSPHYKEPSLVYHLGTDIDLTNREIDLSRGGIVILNALHKTSPELSIRLSKIAKKRKRCLRSSRPINGFNYSRGETLSLVILREGLCKGSRRKGRS